MAPVAIAGDCHEGVAAVSSGCYGIEDVLSERTRALQAAVDAGPADMLVIEESGRPVRVIAVLGADVSSAASVAAEIARHVSATVPHVKKTHGTLIGRWLSSPARWSSLAFAQPEASPTTPFSSPAATPRLSPGSDVCLDDNSGSERHDRAGAFAVRATYCSYNALASRDVRVTATLPGAVSALAVVVGDFGSALASHPVTAAGWEELELCGIARALLYADAALAVRGDACPLVVRPVLSTPLSMSRFLESGSRAINSLAAQHDCEPGAGADGGVHDLAPAFDNGHFVIRAMVRMLEDEGRLGDAVSILAPLCATSCRVLTRARASVDALRARILARTGREPEAFALLCGLVSRVSAPTAAAKDVCGDGGEVSDSPFEGGEACDASREIDGLSVLLHAQTQILLARHEDGSLAFAEDTLAIARRAATLSPLEPLSWLLLARVLVATGNVSDALRALNTIAPGDRVTVDALETRAVDVCLSCGALSECVCEHVLGDSRTHARAYAVLVEAARRTGWELLLEARSRVFLMAGAVPRGRACMCAPWLDALFASLHADLCAHARFASSGLYGALPPDRSPAPGTSHAEIRQRAAEAASVALRLSRERDAAAALRHAASSDVPAAAARAWAVLFRLYVRDTRVAHALLAADRLLALTAWRATSSRSVFCVGGDGDELPRGVAAAVRVLAACSTATCVRASLGAVAVSPRFAALVDATLADPR